MSIVLFKNEAIILIIILKKKIWNFWKIYLYRLHNQNNYKSCIDHLIYVIYLIRFHDKIRIKIIFHHFDYNHKFKSLQMNTFDK